jgi:NADPH2:quinone reductase
MKTAWYESNGEAKDVMTVGERPTPQAGAGEVKRRVCSS